MRAVEREDVEVEDGDDGGEQETPQETPVPPTAPAKRTTRGKKRVSPPQETDEAEDLESGALPGSSYT
jgi:hypothetical protein